MHSALISALLLLPFAAAAIQYSDVGMLCLVNAQRRKHGLSALGLDSRLTSAAKQHSSDQAKHHKMSHTGSDGSSPSQRIQHCGFNWQNSGENVAFGYNSMQEVMNTWMNSPGHRANILSKDFTMFGSAVAASGSTNYFTQDFGREMGKGGRATNVPRCDGSDNDSGGGGSGGRRGGRGGRNSMNSQNGGSSMQGRGGGGGGRRGGRGGRNSMNSQNGGSSMQGRGGGGGGGGGRRGGRRGQRGGGSGQGGSSQGGNGGSSRQGRGGRGGRGGGGNAYGSSGGR